MKIVDGKSCLFAAQNIDRLRSQKLESNYVGQILALPLFSTLGNTGIIVLIAQSPRDN